MAGRGGSEQSRRVESGPAAGALPVLAGGAAGGSGGTEAAPQEDAGSADGAGGADGSPGGADAAALDLLGDPSQGEVCLASRPESAARARRQAVSVMRGWGLDHCAETVELLVSELVGNAVRHTGGGFGLRIRRRRGWIRVEVRDPSRALPCLLPVHDLDVSGRGLFLVDKLSDRWGVDLQPRGKTTWFELRIPEGRP